MMSKVVDVTALLQAVGAKSKDELETVLDNSSPSMMEYSIKNLIEYSDESYFNLSQVEMKFTVGCIEIIFDYENNCHVINHEVSEDDGQTYL